MGEREISKLLEPVFKVLESRFVQVILVLLVLIAVLVGLQKGRTRASSAPGSTERSDASRGASGQVPQVAGHEPFIVEQLCKAAISVLMGRDPASMTAERDGELVRNSYVRESDHSVWSQRCRFEGSRIIWASDTGRWRTHAADEQLTFTVFQGTTEVLLHFSEEYSDGSETTKNFT